MAKSETGTAVATWATLLVLLGAALEATRLLPGALGTLIVLAIAVTQASLILIVLMDLRTGGTLLRAAALTGFSVLILLATLVYSDYGTRSRDYSSGRFAPVTDASRSREARAINASPPAPSDHLRASPRSSGENGYLSCAAAFFVNLGDESVPGSGMRAEPDAGSPA